MKNMWKTLNNLLGRNKHTRLPDFLKIMMVIKLLTLVKLRIILIRFLQT